MAKKFNGPRGISDLIVQDRTGKPLKQWFAILDRFAKLWGHKPKPDSKDQKKFHTTAAKFLGTQYPKLGGWWQQVLVVRYEWSRGLRTKIHRDKDKL